MELLVLLFKALYVTVLLWTIMASIIGLILLCISGFIRLIEYMDGHDPFRDQIRQKFRDEPVRYYILAGSSCVIMLVVSVFILVAVT